MSTNWNASRGEEGYPFSASQLKVFQECPLQYWYEYVSDIESYEADSEHALLGSAVHKTLEIELGKGLHALGERLRPRFYNLVDRFGIEDEELIEKGERCLPNAVRAVNKYEPDIVSLEDEVEFEVNRDGMDRGFRGKLDVVTENEIWDWKTGNEYGHEWIQATVYAAGFISKYGREPDIVRFIFLANRDATTFEADGGEAWDDLMELAHSALEAQRSGEYPANPEANCGWCAYELFCPETPAGFGQIPWRYY